MAALTGQRAGDALLSTIGAILLEQTALSTSTYPTLTFATEKLNEVYRRIQGMHPWTWLYKEATVSTVAGTKEVTLADDCERPIGMQIQGSAQGVRYMPRNRILLEYPGGWSSVGNTTPWWWTESAPAANNAQAIALFPTPDAAYTLTYQYQARPAAITNASNSYSVMRPEYEDALIYGTVADLFRMLSDPRADYYEAKFREIMARCWRRDEQQLDGPSAPILGGGASAGDTWHPYLEG